MYIVLCYKACYVAVVKINVLQDITFECAT